MYATFVRFIIVALDNLKALCPLSRLELAAIAAPLLMSLSCFRWLANFWGVSMFGLVVYLGGVMGVACVYSIQTLSNHSDVIHTGEDSSVSHHPPTQRNAAQHAGFNNAQI